MPLILCASGPVRAASAIEIEIEFHDPSGMRRDPGTKHKASVLASLILLSPPLFYAQFSTAHPGLHGSHDHDDA